MVQMGSPNTGIVAETILRKQQLKEQERSNRSRESLAAGNLGLSALEEERKQEEWKWEKEEKEAEKAAWEAVGDFDDDNDPSTPSIPAKQYYAIQQTKASISETMAKVKKLEAETQADAFYSVINGGSNQSLIYTETDFKKVSGGQVRRRGDHGYGN